MAARGGRWWRCDLGQLGVGALMLLAALSTYMSVATRRTHSEHAVRLLSQQRRPASEHWVDSMPVSPRWAGSIAVDGEGEGEGGERAATETQSRQKARPPPPPPPPLAFPSAGLLCHSVKPPTRYSSSVSAANPPAFSQGFVVGLTDTYTPQKTFTLPRRMHPSPAQVSLSQWQRPQRAACQSSSNGDRGGRGGGGGNCVCV